MTADEPLTTDALMRLSPVIPVLTILRAADAVPLARALVAGGLRALEITLRTPQALEAIEAVARAVPNAVVGAGTVLNATDFEKAERAGARFVVSPGLTEPLAKVAANSQLAFLPGVASASDIMRGLDHGLDHFKFFPAETSGGAAALRAFWGPFSQCRFCPTGGISAASAPEYLSLPNVLCVGGAWVAPPKAVEAGDWNQIFELARAAARLPRERRS